MTARVLKLSADLSLPLEAVSRTFGILAVRGAGKSNTAAVMAEEMFAAGLPFVVIDPVGSWYGLRSSADGKAPGLPIPIFGGKHGDVPLERGAGELIADLVVEKRLTCVLDLSRFDSEADKKAFLLAFARRLYLKNENPLHLFLEEADDYIPQSPMGDEKILLRAWENIVRRGRARGLGMTLITQRSAAVAKMVLTQVETLFAMRTTGPQDIAAIEAWVKYHQVGKDVLSTLASLEDGEAWVWSPHFLKQMARHQIRRRQTFDSGATPANVRAKDTRPPATLADIDLSALQERMAATIEKAKADDPRELRKQLAEKDQRIKQLESGLAKQGAIIPGNIPTKAVLTEKDREILSTMSDRIQALTAILNTEADAIVESVRVKVASAVNTATTDMMALLGRGADEGADRLNQVGFNRVLDKIAAHIQPPTTTAAAPRSPQASRVAPASAPATRSRPARLVSVSEGVSKAEQRILDSVAWWEAAGVDTPSRHQAAFVARYTVNGHFNNLCGALKSKGLIDYPSAGGLTLTEAGGKSANLLDTELTREELIERVMGVLRTESLQRIFKAVVKAGRDLTREDLAAATNYTVNGHFNNMVGSLRSLGVIDYPSRGGVRLAQLFDALS